MKKLIVLTLLTGLLLSALPAVSAAPDAAYLAQLASYYPEKTVFFATVDISNDTIAKLDYLAAYLSERFPDTIPADFTFSDTIDNLVRQNLGAAGDFETLIGSWLGDQAAIGLPSIQTAMAGSQNAVGPFIYTVEITDRVAAETFFGGLLRSEAYSMEREDEMTTFTPETWQRDPTIAILDEIMFIVPNPRVLDRVPEVSLADNPDFAGSIGALPSDEYQIVLYLDTQGILKPMMSMMNMSADSAMMPKGYQEMLDIIGPQTFGFVFLDNRTLVMDIVQRYNNLNAMREMGVEYDFDQPPVDIEFAAHVPGDAPVVLQSTNMGPYTKLSLNNLRAVGPLYQEIFLAQLEQSKEYMNPVQYRLATNLVRRYLDFDYFITSIKAGYASLTGLNLEKDVLAWMTGDYAVFARMLPFENETSHGQTVDIAAVTEATDPEAIADMMDGLQYALVSYNGVYNIEEIGGGEALVLPNITASFFPEGAYEPALKTPELHIMAGANDDVFAWGTRPGVTFGMDPGEDSLAANPNYITASDYFIDGATSIAFLNPDGLIVLVDIYLEVNNIYVEILQTMESPAAAEELEAAGAHDAAIMLKIMQMIDSATISSKVDTEASVQRFTITLSE